MKDITKSKFTAQDRTGQQPKNQEIKVLTEMARREASLAHCSSSAAETSLNSKPINSVGLAISLRTHSSTVETSLQREKPKEIVVRCLERQ